MNVIHHSITALVAATSLAFSCGSQAMDQSGSFAVKGVGIQPCKIFLDLGDNNKQELLFFMAWLEGYVTQYNQLSTDTFDLMPWQSPALLAKSLQLICHQSPDLPFVKAAERLVRELTPHKVSNDSPRVTIEIGEQRGSLYQEIIVRIQEKLQQRSLVDTYQAGVWDQTTQVGIKRFQQQLGLEQTGFPDQDTLLRLLLLPTPH